MLPELDPRYETLAVLRRHEGRLVVDGRDRLTGRPVVLKTDDPLIARQELRTLLALPPGVGPTVLDAVWHAKPALLMVLERFQGQTLQAAAPGMSRERVAAVIHATTQLLGHLHRAGFVHADLKPSNIFLCAEGAGTRVRLIDFGFAISRAGYAVEAPEEQLRGGTPPYLAPEIRQGWIVDGRADQYSLGMTVRKLFPDLEADSIWGPIIEKLCARSPARRYAHIFELRAELERHFGPLTGPESCPPFGGGALRERGAELKEVTAAIQNNRTARILLSARPGIGLSRFMCEALLAVAAVGGPDLRLLDLGAMEPDTDHLRISALVEECGRTDGAILLGVPDPSPDFHWCGRETGRWLREMHGRPIWQRRTLRPLGVESLVELVAECLGLGGDLPDQLARWLHAGTDGDLRCAAEAFRAHVQEFGVAQGLHWELRGVQAQGLPQAWSSPAPGPHWTDVDAALAPALKTLARAGRSFPRQVAIGLLNRFAEPHSFKRLMDHAYLETCGGDRIQFVTRHLWQEAAAQGNPDAAWIDQWLNEHHLPDRGNPEEVIAACQRARRLGLPDMEATYLERGLEHALEARKGRDALRLFAYPDRPPTCWTVARVRDQVRRVHDRMGIGSSEQQLLLDIGICLQRIQPDVATALLKMVAEGEDHQPAIEALFRLLGITATQADPEPFAAYREAIERRRKRGALVPAGVVDYYQACRARFVGRPDEAAAFAQRAVPHLANSGRPEESVNLQILAILRFAHEPEKAVDAMRAAIAAAPDDEFQAQMRFNLSIMYDGMGNLKESARSADEGIRLLRDRASDARLLGLRIRRACSWLDLDRVAEALKEAQELLNSSAVRSNLAYEANVRFVLGEGKLFRFSSPVAITDLAQAWSLARHLGAQHLGAVILRSLLDAFLDLEAWQAVAEYAAETQLDPSWEGAEVETLNARIRALLAQSVGRLDEARAHLESRAAMARDLSTIVLKARYIHHLGLICLAEAQENEDREAALSADRLLRDVVDILKPPGYSYYRGRALLDRSRALYLAGEPGQAAAVLDEVISVSRDAECRGLLALSLRARARAGFDPGPSPAPVG